MPKEHLPTDPKKPNNQNNYAFVQKEGDDFTCIKLAEGKYKDIIYKYDNVKFAAKQNDDGNIRNPVPNVVTLK